MNINWFSPLVSNQHVLFHIIIIRTRLNAIRLAINISKRKCGKFLLLLLLIYFLLVFCKWRVMMTFRKPMLNYQWSGSLTFIAMRYTDSRITTRTFNVVPAGHLFETDDIFTIYIIISLRTRIWVAGAYTNWV